MTLKQNRKILSTFRTYFIHDINGKNSEELSILMKQLKLNTDMTKEDIKNRSKKYLNMLINNIKQEMPTVKELRSEIKNLRELQCKPYGKMNKADLLKYRDELLKGESNEPRLENRNYHPEFGLMPKWLELEEEEEEKKLNERLDREWVQEQEKNREKEQNEKKIKKNNKERKNIKKKIKKLKKEIEKVKKTKKPKKVKKTKKVKVLKKEMDKLEAIEPTKPIKKKSIKNIKSIGKINPEVVQKLTAKRKNPVRPKKIFTGSRGDVSDEEVGPVEKFNSYNIFINDNVFVVANKMQDGLVKSFRIPQQLEKLKEKKKNAKTKTAFRLIAKDEKALEKSIKQVLGARK